MRKILYVSSLVETQYFYKNTLRDINPQIAGNKLESAFLSGFKSNGLDVDVFAFFPASTFPANSKVFFGYRRCSQNLWRMPFINFPGLKLPTRFLSCFIGMLVWSIKNGRGSKICIYSIHTPYLLSAILVRIFVRSNFYLIIPDLPLMMRFHVGRISLAYLLKNIDNFVINFCIKYSSGFSLITKDIVNKLPLKCANIPFVVIEGLLEKTSDSPLSSTDLPESSRPYFLYSGGLSREYGVELMIKAFNESDCEADFIICGTGILAKYVCEAAIKDPRIKFIGFINQEKLKELQKNAAALLLVRDPEARFVKYSFPSKLIEYMASGSPVICSRLPCIPDEYYSHLVVLEKYDSVALSEHFINILNFKSFLSATKRIASINFINTIANPQMRVAKFISIIFSNNK